MFVFSCERVHNITQTRSWDYLHIEISHCVKSVQIRSFFWSVFSCIWTEYVFSPNTEKYGPEKTPYLDTFHTVSLTNCFVWQSGICCCSLRNVYPLDYAPCFTKVCHWFSDRVRYVQVSINRLFLWPAWERLYRTLCFFTSLLKFCISASYLPYSTKVKRRYVDRRSHSLIFFKIVFPKNLVLFTRKHLWWSPFI